MCLSVSGYVEPLQQSIQYVAAVAAEQPYVQRKYMEETNRNANVAAQGKWAALVIRL
jgi:hypothetical protein